ncbi:MAG TPA: carboxypeptidase-like regulatory domain-containing protein [Gemmatimonadaceae bacterium]|nr:carboxypeptidase-like regulatory domain-containing protein [Gemmatimonadaceae bacterium]
MPTSRPIPLLAALLAITLALPPVLDAQMGATTDIIIGRITGPQGQPLAGAQVAVTSVETEITRTATTNDRGQYTLLFPDGGGQYTVLVRYIGMSPTQFSLARLADEDRLVGDLQMQAAPPMLENVIVRASANRPGDQNRPEPGSLERALATEFLQRLPIDASDPLAIALLAPGVVAVDATDSTAAAVSVAGQRPDLNNVTLDGATFAGAGVPEEAVRMTRVITNTYDVSRGQFSGGQIASTTRGGTNRQQGSFQYSLRDPTLQWTDDNPDESTTFGRGYTQHQLSGGIGFPVISNRLFGFGSIQLRRRVDALESLIGADPLTLQRLGVSPDSVDRFLNILEQQYGIPASVAAVPDERLNDGVTLLSRWDYRLSQNHQLMLRGDWRWASQEGQRISARGVPHYGGDMGSVGGGAMLTMSSILGSSLLNEFRAYVSTDDRDTEPYLRMPSGRVRVGSPLAEGGLSISTLEFGGNTSMPSNNDNENVELTNELSWLTPGGAHRYKLGLLFTGNRFASESGNNQFGTFVFNSLEDFEAGMPASFTRTLRPQDRRGGSMGGAIYVGDTWRRSRALQFTYGARLEGSTFVGEPDFNPEVESLFGRRTDRFPSEVHFSPRAGFTWMIGGATQPGGGPGGFGGRGMGGGQGGGRGAFGGGAGGAGGVMGMAQGISLPNPLIIRGGIGEFRGRAPTNLFSAALNATGLDNTSSLLYCVGDVVPTPDWDAYLLGPQNIPEECDGTPSIPVFSSTSRSVTVFDPDFGAPRSWRASLGAQRRFFTRYNVSADFTYSYGVNLYDVQDLNLVGAPGFTLAAEGGRPVYAPVEAIVPTTGSIALAGSRRHDEFGHVFEVSSGLRSHTGQATISLGGFTLRGIQFSTSYTLMRSLDQSSFSGGSAQGGFSSPTTAGDPNERLWSTSDLERRHSLVSTVTYPFRPWLEVTAIGRASSGRRFTPMVGGDVNGDGVRNDRAFVFDPAATGDPAVAEAMTRLIERSSDRVRECLESQIGRVANRNSCDGTWTPSLDLRANIRPTLPSIGRRLTLSVSAINPLTGIDQLIHGSNNLRGWGQPSRPDATLLYVRGFDAGTQQFVYEVNERFGESRTSRTAIRSPFQLAVTGRFSIGPDPRERMQEAMRQMGARFAGERSGAGGPGGAGGGPGGAGRGAMGGTPTEMLERLMINPVAGVLELRDTLGLSEEQVATLSVLSDSLQAKYAATAKALTDALGRAQGNADIGSTFMQLRPRLEQVRTDMQDALRETENALTPEQWAKVPASLKNPIAGMGGQQQRRRP